jgi:hypothetical protein
MKEIHLWLDNYNDIYSDFDSRHYLKRRISDDFLHELKIAFRNQEGRAGDLVLLLPKDKRKENIEKLIGESLKNHFTAQYHIQDSRLRKLVQKNVLFFILGIVLMIGAIFIGYTGNRSFRSIALEAILEPGGWFFLWSSLDFLFYDFREFRNGFRLFKQLSEINIHFRSE